MPNLGRTVFPATSPYPTRVSADGSPKYRIAGVTLDAATIPAASGSDVTLPDGTVIKANTQYLRYGQILTKETVGLAVQTVTFGGTPTGGTYTLTYAGQTTAAIAWNATAAQVQAALNALPALGPAGIVAASGGPGPTAIPVTFGSQFGTAALMTANGAALTGTAPTVTVANTTPGVATVGRWGPYDPAATDGRQTLTRGNCGILDQTYVVNPAGALMAGLGSIDQIGGVFEAGDVWFERLLITPGTHTLAAGPTIAEFEAAFPRISYTPMMGR